jgi:hypothetical protein
VDSDSHWPSDVFVAAITGHVIARAIVARQDQRGRGRGARVGLAPWPGGVRLAVAF